MKLAHPLLGAIAALLLATQLTTKLGKGRKPRQPVAILSDALWLAATGGIALLGSFCFAIGFALSDAEPRIFAAWASFALLAVFLGAWTKLAAELSAFSTETPEGDSACRYRAANDH